MFKGMIRPMEVVEILPTCQKGSASSEMKISTTISVF